MRKGSMVVDSLALDCSARSTPFKIQFLPSSSCQKVFFF